MRGTRSRLRRTAGVALVLLAVTACGSQLDPQTVARAGGQGATAGVGADTGGSGGSGSDSGLDGGTGAGGPGSGGAGGSGSGGSGGGGGTTGGGSGGSGGSAGSGTTGGGSASGGVKAGSCAGFKNQTGVTDKTITLANVSDISGPVPGIFESAQQAARAYVAYFNSQGSICGRKLELINLDSRADAGADQQAYVKACDQAFAAVGSMSAFDSGGAATADRCGLPDLRSTIVNPERQDCRSCIGAYTIKTNLISDPAAKWLAAKYPAAVKNAAFLYINAGAAPVNAKSLAAGFERSAGWSAKYIQGIDVAEFNFAPYVQQMKDKGIRAVIYYGPYQNTVKLQQAMQQQGFKPDFYLQDPTIYDRRYVDQAGGVAEGVYVFAPNDLFENTKNAEVQLYLSWLQQVKPGAIPNYYGLFAWSAARLFVEKAIALGGRLTRASLVSAVRGTRAWTGNGAHTAMNIASGATPPCLKLIQFKGGRWQQVSPGNYMCGKVVDSGIGG